MGREQVLQQVRAALAAADGSGAGAAPAAGDVDANAAMAAPGDVDVNGAVAVATGAADANGAVAAAAGIVDASAAATDADPSVIARSRRRHGNPLPWPLAAPPASAAAPAWEYGRPTAVEDVIGLFIERVEDYKAHVIRAAAADVPNRISECLADAQAKAVVLPPGLDASWVAAAVGQGIEARLDDPPLPKLELDQTDAVVTAACVGMAETGTIVLDHQPDQGRRIISLLPDTHICVIRADQIVTDVPEAMARLSSRISSGRPLTWVSGPSATSDIELERVEGVHGPRHLYVIVAE